MLKGHDTGSDGREGRSGVGRSVGGDVGAIGWVGRGGGVSGGVEGREGPKEVE